MMANKKEVEFAPPLFLLYIYEILILSFLIERLRINNYQFI